MKTKTKTIILLLLILFLISNVLVSCSLDGKDEEAKFISNLDKVGDAADYGIIETYLSTEEKIEDFEYLYKLIEGNYSFLEVNKRVNNIDWLGKKEKYIEIIEATENDAQFIRALGHIVRDLNNGHTSILPSIAYEDFYQHYYKYEEKYDNKVLLNEKTRLRYNASDEPRDIYDTRSHLNSDDPAYETDIIIEDKVAYLKIKRMYGNRVELDRNGILEFLRSVKDYEKLIIDIRGNGGGFVDYWIRNIMQPLIKEKVELEYLSFFKGDYRDKYPIYKVKEEHRDINELDHNTLAKLPEEIKDYDYYTINKVTIEQGNTVGFKGQIYLLIDEGVYSASETFAAVAKDSGFAILVGDTTGGDMVFEIIPFASLSNSGIVLNFSSELCINSDGTINIETKTTPHIKVNPIPNEDLKKDKCVKAVIKDRKYYKNSKGDK